MINQDLNQVPLDEICRLFKESSERYAKFLEEYCRVIDKRLEAGGQFFTPATIKIPPKEIVETAEEIPRPPIVLVETESVVGLEERVQVSESKIDLENGSSEECSHDEQDQDTILDAETTPIDMIIGNKADIKKSHSPKLFELKAEIGEIIMPGGIIIVQHNRRSKMKKISPSQKYLEKILYSA